MLKNREDVPDQLFNKFIKRIHDTEEQRKASYTRLETDYNLIATPKNSNAFLIKLLIENKTIPEPVWVPYSVARWVVGELWLAEWFMEEKEIV